MNPPDEPPRNAHRLTAVVVNYRTGAFALSCVRSLRREWRAAGEAPGDLEVILVDNASPIDQRPWLDALAREGVRVLASASNGGYAAGVQMGLAASRQGGADDYLALLHPDTVFLPGSVATLIEHLELHPECGAVAPRAFWDEDRYFRLAPPELPHLLGDVLDPLAEVWSPLARARDRRRTRARLASWEARQPVRQSALSDACLFLPRQLASDLDPLLDPRYPLFFEGADLCRRLVARGLSLALHPGAEVLHHAGRSLGPEGALRGEAARRFEASRRAYRAHFFGGPARALVQAAEEIRDKVRRRRPHGPAPIHDVVPLGRRDDRVELELEAPGRVILELSRSPVFGQSAGASVDAGAWRFPAAAWSWLYPGRWFLRALDPESGRVLRAWSFQKTSAAREHPVELERAA